MAKNWNTLRGQLPPESQVRSAVAADILLAALDAATARRLDLVPPEVEVVLPLRSETGSP